MDDTPSGYDLALASLLANEGFSDEEIVIALYANRLQHGDDVGKLFRRPNGDNRCYQLDTLKKARQRKKPVHGQTRFAFTDLGNAERLAALHGRDLRFVRYRGNKGDWHIWTGQRWALDNIGVVQSRAKSTVRGMYGEASEIQDDGARSELVKHARKSESSQRIAAMLDLAKSERPIPIPSTVLDNRPWLLNVKNGTIDLRIGELRPHCRDDYLTKVCDVAYDPAATPPRWEKFLSEIMGGNKELIEFLQRLMGMCLTGDISEHVFPIFYGAGRNGKNTFLDVFLAFMGDYANPAPASLLVSRRNASEHPTDVASLWGKRLVIASETEEGAALKASLVKSLTGDGFLEARFMHKDYFKFPRTHKTILMTNNKPLIRDRSDAMWERVKLVPFTQQFRGDRADRRLPEKLKLEYPGILRWAVEGCLKWHKQQSLAIPEEVAQATRQYQSEEDPIAEFLEDCCTVSADQRSTRREIWFAYTQWAEHVGERPLPQKAFYARLRDGGFKDARFKVGVVSVRGFLGLGVRSIVDSPQAKGS